MSVLDTRITSVTTPVPGPKSRALIDRWRKAEAATTGYQAPVVWDRAEGVVVQDVDGNRYIDWTSGVLVTNVGHCHPRLREAVHEATDRLLNCYEFPTEYRVRAAEGLVRAAPPHLDTCFFLSTGSEATEAAMRIMKRKTGRFEIIGFHGGFHGRTFAAASAGGMQGPKKGYGPSMPGVIRAPFPYCYRCPFHSEPDRCGTMCLEFLDDIVRADSTGSIAGVITEPYQGASGFVFPPEGWLSQLETWARQRGILFTLDEVQSCFGRTGRMWAMDWEGVTPDIVCLGKGIGSGVPVSALLARSSAMDALGPGEMSSTAGGNPVSSAAVIAVLEIMQTGKLADNALRVGATMKERLLGIMEKCKYLGDVRGRGLVMGLEIVADKRTKQPSPELTRAVIDKCAEGGVLVGSVGLLRNVIRVAPPLVISEAEAEESVEIMESVLLSI